MRQNKKLRIAAIMDEFTYHCYAPECELMQITPDHFREEIDSFQPDMLFVESVWRGKDNLWRSKLHDNMEDITALTDYCHSSNIPVVFWSKEDPVHFGVFCKTAALADYVFTTDADSVELYKTYLGHDRVYYLPFAAQPAQHNPVEEYKREDKFCFAGSFYVKYKERSQVFMDLAPLFLEQGLDIYDRNFKKGETDTNSQSTSVASPIVENYYFPLELQGCILGGLPYSEITKAYKGYKYGINMTSMVQSGFMFARRVFELLACNTVVVSNYSRGLEVFFGDLIIATNNKEQMKKQLDRFCGTELDYRKYRLAGLRHVLTSHLYGDRLDRVAQKALGITIKKPLPEILVVCRAENEHVREMFEKQTYEHKKLIIAETGTKLSDLAFDYITVFSEHDYYGKNYLMDLALATRYASDDVIGKAAYYAKDSVMHIEKAYTHVQEEICLSRQMAAKRFFDDKAMITDLFDCHVRADILSLDEFNYCESSDDCEEVNDLDIYTGVPLDEIYAYTDSIQPVALHRKKTISTKELYEELIIKDTDFVTKQFDGNNFRLVREADDDEIVWLYTNKTYQISDYSSNNRIGFYTETSERSGNVRCQIEYYDENNVKLGFLNFVLDGFNLLRICDGAKSFKLIFRMRGKSSVTLTKMDSLSPELLLAAPFPVRSSLLITENYPDYDNPNLERRLHEFAIENHLEVLKVGEDPRYLPYSEYEGIQIVSAQYGAIKEYVNARKFDSIYIDSSSEKISMCLSDYKGRIVTV